MKKIIALICMIAMLLTSVSAFAAGYDAVEAPAGVYTYGYHCFHDGFVPVMTDEGWRYMDINGTVMPWNDFTTAFGFSEGLAAVEKDGKIGYINTSGELVIGWNSDAKFSMSVTYAGRFIGGKAVAMVNTSGQTFDAPADAYEYHYINTKGENVGALSAEEIENIDNLLYADHGGSYTDNYVDIDYNGASYEYVPMDEGAAVVEDYETGKVYIVKESASTGETSAPMLPAPSDWAAEEVTKAAEYGLLTGLEGIHYQKDVTRAEFAKLIVNCVTPVLGLSAEEIVGENPSQFTDVDDVSVNTAALLGIVNGVGDGLFAPDKAITRQEIAVMMHRAINAVSILLDKTYISAATADLEGFTDAASVADWAKTAVATLAANEVMKGTGEGVLSPLNETSVEQSILLAVRIFELMK